MAELKNIPEHVSIIMDGNGRWAREKGLERVKGHVEGVERVRDITEECVRLGIRYLSLFAFSEENWGRPEKEVSSLMALMARSMANEYSTMMKNGVRFVVLGNLDRLSADLLAAIRVLENKTASNSRLTMIVFLSYSGQWDILQAARKMAAEGTDSLERYLVTAGYPDPDLIIRTSGEKRISNYLLWQAAYSEFVFTDTLWPDFRKECFRAALEEYSSRDRRFGKVK